MAHPLRQRLPRTYQAFLGRFQSPNEVQQLAAEPILAGCDLLLCAPTASGKTEAFAAPLVERLLDGPRAPLMGLLVSPTRALANDLFRRLEGRMHELGVSFGRYTAEHKERQRGGWPEVVVLTPEGLDSLLARRPKDFAGTRAIVLDEIHVIDGGPRGDQLRVLLHRLAQRVESFARASPEARAATEDRARGASGGRTECVQSRPGIALRGAETPRGPEPIRESELPAGRAIPGRDCTHSVQPLQRIAASATVGEPGALASRYLLDPEVVSVEGGRDLRFKSFQGTSEGAICEHLTTLARAGLRKVLVFCNSRRDVERYAAALRGQTPFEDRIFPHHGSLSKTIRERSEQQFLNAPAGVAVSTMTLELGIDIGSVDYVLLTAPPTDVSSLMQRIGRGGRRAKTMRVGVACEDAGAELLYRVMARCGVRGEYHERPYAFRPSVLVQQAIVMAGALGYASVARLERAVPPELREHLGAEFADEILSAMWHAELLEAPRNGRYVLSEEVEKRYARGNVHSNFSEPPDIDVVDRLTGDVIGRLSRGLELGPRVNLGGAGRRAVHQDGERILTDRARDGEAANYQTAFGGAKSFGLARAVAAELGAEERELMLVPTATGWCLVHGLGTLGGLFLADQLRRFDHVVARATAFTLRLGLDVPELPVPSETDLEAFLRRHRARLTTLCEMGPYHRHLPDRLATQALREACGLEEVIEFLAEAELVTRAARTGGDALELL